MHLTFFVLAYFLTTSLGAPPVQLSSDAGSDSHERFNSSITDAGTGQKQSSDESQRQSRAEKNEIISHLMGLLGKLPRSSPEQMKLLRRDDGENTHFGKLSLNPIKRLRDGYYSFLNGIVTFVPYEKVDSAQQSGFNKSDQPVKAQEEHSVTEERFLKSDEMLQDTNKKTKESLPSEERIPIHEKFEQQTQPTVSENTAYESERHFFITRDSMAKGIESEQKSVPSFSDNLKANNRQQAGLQPETTAIPEALSDESVQPMKKRDEASLVDHSISNNVDTNNEDQSLITKGARKDYKKLGISPITLKRQPVIDLNPHRKTPLKLGGIGLPVLKSASGLSDSMTFQPTAAWNMNDIKLNSDKDKFPRVKLDNGTVLIPMKLSDGLVLYSNSGFDNRPSSQMEQQLNTTIAMKQMDALFPGFEKALRNNFTQVIVQNIFFNIAETKNTNDGVESQSSTTTRRTEEPGVTAPPVLPEETSPLSSFNLSGVGSDYDYLYDDDGYELKLSPTKPHDVFLSPNPNPQKATSVNLSQTKDDHLDHHVHHSLLALAEQLAFKPSVSTSGSVKAGTVPVAMKTSSHNLLSTTEPFVQPNQGTENTISNPRNTTYSSSHADLAVKKSHITNGSTVPFSMPSSGSTDNQSEEEAANGVSKPLLSSAVVLISRSPAASTSRLQLPSQSTISSQPVTPSSAVIPSTTPTRLTTISVSANTENSAVTTNNFVSSSTTERLTPNLDTGKNNNNKVLDIQQNSTLAIESQKITATAPGFTTPHNQGSFSPPIISSTETTPSISSPTPSTDALTTQKQTIETTAVETIATAVAMNETSSTVGSTTTVTVTAANRKSAAPNHDQSANWAMKVVQSSGPKQQMLMKFMSPNMFKFMQSANKTQQETIITAASVSPTPVTFSPLQRQPPTFSHDVSSATPQTTKIQHLTEQLQASHNSTSESFETSTLQKAETTSTTVSLQPEPKKTSTILFPFSTEKTDDSTPEYVTDLQKEDVVRNKDQLPLTIPAQEPTFVIALNENVEQETDSEPTTTLGISTETEAIAVNVLQLSEAATAASQPIFIGKTTVASSINENSTSGIPTAKQPNTSANLGKVHNQKLETTDKFSNDSGTNEQSTVTTNARPELSATQTEETLTTKSVSATAFSDLKTISSTKQAHTSLANSSTQKTSTSVSDREEIETNPNSNQYLTAVPSTIISSVNVAAQSMSTPAITLDNDNALKADEINLDFQTDLDVKVNVIGNLTPKFTTVTSYPTEEFKQQSEANSTPWLMFHSASPPIAVTTKLSIATGKFVTPPQETTSAPPPNGSDLDTEKVSTVVRSGSNKPTIEIITISTTEAIRNPVPSTSLSHVLKAPANTKWTIMGPRRPAEGKPAAKQQLTLPWYMTMYTTKNPMKTVSQTSTISTTSKEITKTTTASLERSRSTTKYSSHLIEVTQNREAATSKENELHQVPSATTLFESSSTSAPKITRLPLWEEIPTPGLKVTKKPYILPITGNYDTAPTSLSYDFSLFTKPTSEAGTTQNLVKSSTDNQARRPTQISGSHAKDSDQLGSHQNHPWPIFFVTDNPKGKPTPVTSQEENSLQDLPLALGDLQTTEPATKNEELSYVKGDALFSWQESENDDDPIEAFPTENRFSCNQMTKEHKVSFLSPKHPEPDDQKGICTLRIFIARKSICQLRVDFNDVRMLLPRQGFCLDQYLQISGSAKTNGIERFCGRNPDQHFYIELEEASMNGLPRHVDFTVVTAHSGYLYRYGMLIRQVECSRNNKLQAPAGCTQYFPQALGVIKSFNFDGGQYFNNQSYSICIRSSTTACAISFEASEANFGIQKLNSKRVPANRAGVGDRVCNRDYLRLPGGVPDLQPGTSAQDRYCGAVFSPFHGDNTSRPVLSFIRNKIIKLDFEAGLPAKFNANHHGPGFKLSFSQLSTCNTGDARRSRELKEEQNRIVNIPSRQTSSGEHSEGSLFDQHNFSERLSYKYDYYDEFGDNFG